VYCANKFKKSYAVNDVNVKKYGVCGPVAQQVAIGLGSLAPDRHRRRRKAICLIERLIPNALQSHCLLSSLSEAMPSCQFGRTATAFYHRQLTLAVPLLAVPVYATIAC